MFGLTAIECFIAIVIIFVVAYWITPRKASWIPIILVTVLLSFLAFKMMPNYTDDLSRYFSALEAFRAGGKETLHRYIEDDRFGWKTYRVAAYYFYYISKLNNNHFLPAITIFIVYGLGFLTIYRAAKRFEVNKVYLFLAVFFFISTYWFYDTASGIRNGLSFAIAFACAYYHLVERKNIVLCYVGYILACFIHSAGILVVVFVIIAELTLNTSGKFMNFLFIFGLAMGGALIEYLSDRTDNVFIQSIAGKAESHEAGDSLETGTMYLVNVATFVLVIIVLVYVSNYILHSKYSNELKRFYKYSSLIIYFLVGCLYSGLIFVRFARWILPLIGALLFMIGMQIQNKQIDEKGITYFYYYAPFNQSVRIKIRPLFILVYIAYTGVHLWYLCAGSSLHWIHF